MIDKVQPNTTVLDRTLVNKLFILSQHFPNSIIHEHIS